MSNRSLLGARDKRKGDIDAGGNAFVEGFNDILETSSWLEFTRNLFNFCKDRYRTAVILRISRMNRKLGFQARLHNIYKSDCRLNL